MRRDGQAFTRSGVAGVWAFRLVLAAGFLLALAANLPGHLSVDSVIALEEARSGVRQTWAPAVVSWLLGLFDEVVAGTGLYVTACAALLFFSLMSLAGLRARTPWLAAVAAAAAVLTPQLLVYQGIVWKDVLFANLVIAAFACLSHAAQGWDRRPPALPLAGALICLALAVLARQNGVVLALFAALALGWAARRRGLRSSLAWGVGGLAAVLLLAAGIDRIAQPPETAPKLRPNAAALILQHYDVVGAAAREPRLKLTEIGRANPAAQAVLEANAGRIYSPARVDTLDLEPEFRRALWRTPDAAMSAQWRDVIRNHTGAYLAHRWEVFLWVALTPDLAQCLPVHVGVSGPGLERLGMVTGADPQDQAVGAYARRFFGTPLFAHKTFGLIALAVAGLLLLRRSPADGPIIALQIGALAFTASFFAISVACDYRYLYVLDLAAITGLLYLALDPVVWRRK